jgi:HSP20 family protein
MHTINLPVTSSTSRHRASESVIADYRRPHFDCQEHADVLRLVVYVPGVAASGVEITTRGPDLTVTARKTHFVRANWAALHLERAQRDYQLRLRLGHGFDYPNLTAEIADGVLTITLPKRVAADSAAPLRRVA